MKDFLITLLSVFVVTLLAGLLMGCATCPHKDEAINWKRQADQCKKAYVDLLNKDKDFSYLSE